MNAKDAVEGLAAWHADTGRLWIAQSSFALACRAHAEPPHVGRRPAQKGSLSLCSSSAWDDIQTLQWNVLLLPRRLPDRTLRSQYLMAVPADLRCGPSYVPYSSRPLCSLPSRRCTVNAVIRRAR